MLKKEPDHNFWFAEGKKFTHAIPFKRGKCTQVEKNHYTNNKSNIHNRKKKEEVRSIADDGDDDDYIEYSCVERRRSTDTREGMIEGGVCVCVGLLALS